MADLIYPDLSYRIMGILFKVHNELGFGYKERHYQRALKAYFEKERMPYVEQEKVRMAVNGIHIGYYFIDFVIDGKIVLEIKATPRFSRKDVLQVIRYLKTTGLNLGILASFSRNELIYKRILRGYDK